MPSSRMNRHIGQVWTKRSISTKAFHPSGPKEDLTDVKQVLCQMEMEVSTGDLTARPAVRYSYDGETWDAAQDIGTETLTGDGPLNSTTWNALPGTPKLYGQFGANVYNSSNTGQELARLAMRVDKRSF